MNSIVHNLDCMIGMREFPDKYFDLAVVDPPFGIGTVKNKFAKHKETFSYKNKITPDENYFVELERVCKATIIFGCQYYLNYMNPEGSFIVWDKGADPDLHNMSSCDVAWYSKRKQIKKFFGRWCGACKVDNEKTIHIHQKPIALYKWIYHNYLPVGGKVLDTHLGSGSNRIASHKAGNIDFTGYELDKDYYEAAEKRYQLFISQLTIPFE